MTFEVKSGSFGYGSKMILNNINFKVQEGEILSILGSNGVGKTTLLKCMMGFLKWKSGSSFLNGEEIKNIKPKDLWQTIAYVPQAKGVAFSYSALDMVTMGRNTRLGSFQQPSKEDVEIASEAMKEVGIWYLKDKLCTQVSGGELQMILIARALTISPKMLILDEPESNLDFKNQLIILDTIKTLSQEKKISAIVNTHYPEHALQLSNQTLMLNRDGSNFYGNTEQVMNEENMKITFGVDVHIQNINLKNKEYKAVIPLKLS